MKKNKIVYVLFVLRNLPRCIRLCAQLIEGWWKLDHCENDEVGTI